VLGASVKANFTMGIPGGGEKLKSRSFKMLSVSEGPERSFAVLCDDAFALIRKGWG
jgi:hypothetical protein